MSEIYNGSLSNGKTRLVNLITSGNMYGYKVTNYSANGINNWSVLYNDGNNVYIMSDDYITESISSYSLSVDAVSFMKDDTQWIQYVDSAVPNAKAYGGATGSMLLASYNAKYGTNYALADYPRLDTTDSLYVIDSTDNYSGYWLATTEEEILTGELPKKSIKIASLSDNNIILDSGASNGIHLAVKRPNPPEECAWSVWHDGYVQCGGVELTNFSLRCVVCLPSELTGTVDTSNGTVTIDK